MSRSGIDKLSIEDLKYLLEVQRSGGFIKAGELFGLSPSSASRTINRLRETLGDPCFVKGKNGLIPTPYFERIRPVVENIVESTRVLSGNTAFRPGDCAMTFRISCVMAEVAHIMGGVIPEMLRQAPGTSIELTYIGGEFTELFKKTVDFAIVTGVDLPDNLHFMNLYPLDRVVLLRKGHPLTWLGRDLTSEDLGAYGRVSNKTSRQSSWTSVEQGLFANEHYREHTKMLTTRLNTGWEVLEQTDLICICGWRAAEIAMRGHSLTALALPEEARQFNPMNQLVWTDYTHNEASHIWLRGIFASWRDQEAQRLATLASQGKGPPGYYRQA